MAETEGDAQAPAVNGGEPELNKRWVKIQEHTFKNWINQQLSGTDYKIDSLTGNVAMLHSQVYCTAVIVLVL